MTTTIITKDTIITKERMKPWTGVGRNVQGASSLEQVMKEANLDWQIEKKQMQVNGRDVVNLYSMGRNIARDFGQYDWKHFGVVTKRYNPIQNIDAFRFLEEIVGEELDYETAGCVKWGKKTFVSCKMKKQWMIGDDAIDNYLLCSNSHDGKGSLHYAITPVRVVCQNMLYGAMKKAKRVYSVRHFESASMRLEEARHVLGLSVAYMDNFVEFGNRAIDKAYGRDKLEGLFDVLFGKKEDKEGRGLTIRNRNIRALIDCMDAPDLNAYHGSVWQVLNAVSDFETHVKPTTDSMRENLAGRILDGNLSLYDKTVKYFSEVLAV